MDSLDGVTIFMTVARCGSFSAAAEALGCAKSTVSAQVTRLERRIGARLLRRSTRSVSLTEAGRAYLCRLDDLLDRVREAEEAARAEATEPRGVLRVSAPAPFAALHLGPLLPEFLKRHPEIRIDLHVTSEVVDLAADGFDLAIRLCPKNDQSMVVRRLGATRIIAAAAPVLFAGGRLPEAPEDLAGLPAVANAAYPDRDLWRLLRDGEERLVPVQPVVLTGCPEMLLRLVRAGVGIGQFSEYHVRDDLLTGRLVQLVPGWLVAEVPVLAVYPDNRQIAAKVRAFVDFLTRHLPDHITLTQDASCATPGMTAGLPGTSRGKDEDEGTLASPSWAWAVRLSHAAEFPWKGEDVALMPDRAVASRIGAASFSAPMRNCRWQLER